MRQLIALLFLFSLSKASWDQIRGVSSPNYSPDDNASPEGRRNTASWCYGDSMYIFGGKANDNRVNDLWKWEAKHNRWLWQPDTPISPRSGQSFWNVAGHLWLYGGRNDSIGDIGLHDMWSYHPESRTWTSHPMTSEHPHIRYGSAIWTDEKRELLYLYGGKTDSNTIVGDLWAFDVNTLKWSEVPSVGSYPGLRDDAMAAVYEDTVYFFGGHDGTGREIPYLKTFNLETLVWSEESVGSKGPETREDQIMWVTGNTLYIYGGKVQSKIFSDFWSYDIISQTWEEINQDSSSFPNGRWGAGYCTNSSGYLHMFGGKTRDSTNLDNDLWVYYPTTKTVDTIEFPTIPPIPSNIQPLVLTTTIMMSLIFLVLLGTVVGGTIYLFKRQRVLFINEEENKSDIDIDEEVYDL